MKRCQILIVGHEAAGKTTLVERLESNKFNASRIMTDGIIMKTFKIKEVEIGRAHV